MTTSRDPSGAAPSAMPHTRRAMRLLLLVLLAASLSIAAPTAPAAAAEPSGACSNDTGDGEMQLLSGDFGLPLWLGVQVGSNDEVLPTVCYGTGAPGESKTLGGKVATHPQADRVGVKTESDSNAGIQANAHATITPSYTVSPGGPSGGQELTFEIPVAVCSGVCYDVPGGGLEATGLIVGQISQKPAPGGVSAAYQVDQLCLMVNGIPVTNCDTNVVLPGATTTGSEPANVGLGGATPGPCLVGVCIPSIDYVGTSGRQLATIHLPGNTAIPVYGVHTCLYQRDAQTPCPA